MRDKNTKPIADERQRNYEKKRTEEQNFLKWHIRAYILISIVAVIFLFTNTGLWPLWIIIIGGVILAINGIKVRRMPSDYRPAMADENKQFKSNANEKAPVVESEITDPKRERLIRIYKRYDTFEWLIVLVIVVTNAILLGLIISDISSLNINSIMNAINNLPAIVTVPFLIIYFAYTVFCFILYVKVWPIREIRNRFTYWLDWFLTIVLTVYELFIFYVLLFA